MEKNIKKECRDSPGGPVVKNLSANAGDAGLIPGEGTKIPQAAGQLSLCALEPAHRKEKPTHHRNKEPTCHNERSDAAK